MIQVLSNPPTNAKFFLVTDAYGRGSISANGEAFKQQVFDGLGRLKDAGLNVGFVNFEEIWDGVFITPGYAAFGYTSDGYCVELNATTTDGACDDPEHTFYWLHGLVVFLLTMTYLLTPDVLSVRHPSKETHRIMADFVEEVLENCQI